MHPSSTSLSGIPSVDMGADVGDSQSRPAGYRRGTSAGYVDQTAELGSGSCIFTDRGTPLYTDRDALCIKK
jgi:hypothetical protein